MPDSTMPDTKRQKTNDCASEIVPEHLTPAQRLREAQEKLLRDNSGDVSIQCGNRSWNCHADLLAQRCDFFRAAFGGTFSESTTKTVKLEDESEEEVDMLLLYLYTLDDPIFSKDEIPPVEGCAALSAIDLGDKYGLPDLVRAGEEFIVQLYEHCVLEPDEKSERIMMDFLRHIEAKNPDGREEMVAQIMATLVDRAPKELIELEEFRILCKDCPEIPFAFMRALLREIDSLSGH